METNQLCKMRETLDRVLLNASAIDALSRYILDRQLDENISKNQLEQYDDYLKHLRTTYNKNVDRMKKEFKCWSELDGVC